MEQSKDQGGGEIPPPNFRPVTEVELQRAKEKIRRSFKGYTLCNVVREVYEIAKTLDDPTREEIQHKCLLIFCYGKRMDSKLAEYKMKERENGESIPGGSPV